MVVVTTAIVRMEKSVKTISVQIAPTMPTVMTLRSSVIQAANAAAKVAKRTATAPTANSAIQQTPPAMSVSKTKTAPADRSVAKTNVSPAPRTQTARNHLSVTIPRKYAAMDAAKTPSVQQVKSVTPTPRPALNVSTAHNVQVEKFVKTTPVRIVQQTQIAPTANTAIQVTSSVMSVSITPTAQMVPFVNPTNVQTALQTQSVALANSVTRRPNAASQEHVANTKIAQAQISVSINSASPAPNSTSA